MKDNSDNYIIMKMMCDIYQKWRRNALLQISPLLLFNDYCPPQSSRSYELLIQDIHSNLSKRKYDFVNDHC